MHRAVVLTRTLPEYASVAARRHFISDRIGVDHLYPILTTEDHARTIGPVLDYHDVRRIAFNDLPDDVLQRLGDTFVRPADRSDRNDDSIAEATSIAALARALDDSLSGGSSTGAAAAPRTGSAAEYPRAHTLALCGAHALLLPAIVYAHATGKRLVWIEQPLDAVSLFMNGGPREFVAVVDQHTAFTRPVIHALVAASQQSANAVALGILTAFSVEAFSALIFRLLALQDFRSAGHRAALPPPLGQPLAEAPAYEFHIVEDHGGAQHMKYDGDGALCGVLASSLRPPSDFDCEAGCPFTKRIPASEVRAHNLFFLGCETMAIADAFVPPQFTLALNAINGWATAVAGPFKHRTGVGMAPFVNALVLSGLSLGEIVWRLNAAGRSDLNPDYSCYLLGDPARFPMPDAAGASPPLDTTAQTHRLDVRVENRFGAMLEIPAPGSGIDRPPVIIRPADDVSSPPDLQFTYIKRPGGANDTVMVWSTAGDLPADSAFRVEHARELEDGLLARVRDGGRRLRALMDLGLPAAVIGHICDQMQSDMLPIFAPREIESVSTVCAPPSSVIDPALERARQSVLKTLLGMMATRNVWLFNERLNVRSFKIPQSGSSPCPICGNELIVWRHDDGSDSSPGREVRDCIRCGAVSDEPIPAEFDVRFDTSDTPCGSVYVQRVRVKNVSARARRASLVVHFNCWKVHGIICDPLIQEIHLAPQESRDLPITFFFDLSRPDDVATIQTFVLSEDFTLSNYLRKVTLRRRVARLQHGGQLSAGPDQAPAWRWTGTSFVRD